MSLELIFMKELELITYDIGLIMRLNHIRYQLKISCIQIHAKDLAMQT